MIDPVGMLDRRFSGPASRPRDLSEIETALRSAELYWLTTVRVDGRPHTTPLVGVWDDQSLFFVTGEGEQKQCNLSVNKAVTVATGSNFWKSGLDVVVEGTSEIVRDRAMLERVLAVYLEKYHGEWTWDVDGGGLVNSLGGAQPLMYRVRPTKVLAFSKGDNPGQTTFGVR